jgi:outer membrane protein, multidrug efflux system
MMNTRYFIWIAISFLFLLISSCNLTKNTTEIKEQKLPSTYFGSSGDSTSLADLSWKEYFKDSMLTALIDSAVANNFDLQIALQRIEIARSELRYATGQMFPTVDAELSMGTTKYAKYTEAYAGNTTTPIPDKPNTMIPNPIGNSLVGLSASWELDVWGKLKSRKMSAYSRFLASEETKHLVVSNLVSEVASSYFELVATDNQLLVVNQTLKNQEEALEIVKFQKEVGQANDLIIQQFESQLITTKIAEKELKIRINELENLINFLLGRFPQKVERNSSALSESIPESISVGLPIQILSKRPDIREAEQMLLSSNFDLEYAKKSFYPSLRLDAGLGFQAFNPQLLASGPASLGYSAVGGLVAPLLNLSSLKAQYSSASSLQLSALLHFQKTVLNGYLEVSNELFRYSLFAYMETLKSQQKEVLKNSVETSLELYKTSKANYLEVLLVQQNYFNAQMEYYQLRKEQKLSQISLYKALGGGW